MELHSALLDQAQIVVKRAEKLYVFYTGEDIHEKPVWNGGNLYRTDTNPVRQLLSSMNEEATWDKIQGRYQSKGSHVYRDNERQSNRHGHSNNLPSYFAFGHNALAEYVNIVSSETWEAYKENHKNCCGVYGAISDLKNFSLLCEHIIGKRQRRAECLNDTAKRDAAIDAKKRGRRRRFTGHMPVSRHKGRVVQDPNRPDSDVISDSS